MTAPEMTATDIWALIDRLDDMELPDLNCRHCVEALNDAIERLSTLSKLVQKHAEERQAEL